jgi:hypothetical protein
MLWLEENAARTCPRLARRQAERFSKGHYERKLLSYLERIAAGDRPESQPIFCNSARSD